MHARLYTLRHPRLRSTQIASPEGGPNIVIDGQGYAHNVPEGAAAKLIKAGYILDGGIGVLLEFGGYLKQYAAIEAAFNAARDRLSNLAREAYAEGAEFSDLAESIAAHLPGASIDPEGLVRDGSGGLPQRRPRKAAPNPLTVGQKATPPGPPPGVTVRSDGVLTFDPKAMPSFAKMQADAKARIESEREGERASFHANAPKIQHGEVLESDAQPDDAHDAPAHDAPAHDATASAAAPRDVLAQMHWRGKVRVARALGFDGRDQAGAEAHLAACDDASIAQAIADIAVSED